MSSLSSCGAAQIRVLALEWGGGGGQHTGYGPFQLRPQTVYVPDLMRATGPLLRRFPFQEVSDARETPHQGAC